MKKSRLVGAVCACAFSFISTFAREAAAQILLSPAEFAVKTTLIDFEAFPDGEVPEYQTPLIYDQWSEFGVIITDSSPDDGAQVAGSTFGIPPHSGIRAAAPAFYEGVTGRDEPNGSIRFDFNMPVSEAGLWIQNGDGDSTISFLDAEDLLLNQWSVGIGDNFAGLSDSKGISAIVVQDIGYFTVDDLQYESIVPVPPALWLFGSGLLGLVGIARRKKA